MRKTQPQPEGWALVIDEVEWIVAGPYSLQFKWLWPRVGVGSRLLFWLVATVFLGATGRVVFGQDASLGTRSGLTAKEAQARLVSRERWFLRGRNAPGQNGAAQRYRAYLQKMRMRADAAQGRARDGTKFTPEVSGQFWSALGPAPLASDASGDGQYDYGWVSGRATAVAVDPADPTGNTVYIGGAYGGVWKSSNAGPASQSAASVVWQPVTDDQATLAVGAIAIQPGNNNSNNSVILVGTGEANSSADSYYGLGILRSADAGNSWTLIPTDSTGSRSFAGMAFSKIAFSSNSPNLAVGAVAGASEGIIEGLENPITANLGLYYSSDNGNSWTYAKVSDGGTTTAPGSATSVVYNAGGGEFFAALRYHGFYSSSDSINWTRLPNQPGPGLGAGACPYTGSPSCPIYRGEIAVVPGRNEMYVWYVDGNDFDQGIWESKDGGNTWLELADTGITVCGDQFGCGTQQGSYNLELAAVPNGTSGVTDLYAGTINLYKCEITITSPICAGTGANTFLNLTHVYGCPPDFGSIAQVHPAQHAAAFMLVNGNTQDVMYFANDGGIYRALDGYSGLTSGTCGIPNAFDSLNGTLGSMTQFVSFSQAPNDASTILGGTQGNGSPGTESTGGSWQNVNFGDGGYTQISPANEEEWFVSNPPDSTSGVNIFSCTNSNGISCHTQDFQNKPIVSSATVGGDTGPYYPPYILDPHPLTSTQLIVGTCRMWRGPSTGGAFTLLSHNFETGGDGICTGGEINLVRSFAAGPALDSNGFSNVMYVGTDGYGPLVPTTPPGGHVWVSTNIAGGPSTWVDQTGAINPNNYPISGIAMDSSDTSGQTAYVSLMGFSTASFPTTHLWQTSNGGESWTDFSGSPPNNLPDAPANAVVVDPTAAGFAGRVYVATDVGVFWSFTASPNWQEVGPKPGSGQAGYLPNVAVTALGIFTNADSTKLLRASTYGRGVWEFPLTPNFSISISNTPMTIFPGQTPPPFEGTIAFLGGYDSLVNLSCSGPSSCAVSPTSVTPPPNLQSLTATVPANNQTGDYSFTLHGIGADQQQTTSQADFVLSVVDFNLTPPSPNPITVEPGSSSGPVQFQVAALGSFEDAVSLSCVVPNQLAGVTCSFQPPGPVNPTAGNPVTVVLTVNTTANQAAATGLIAINGSVGTYTKMQNLSVTVPLDYGLTVVPLARQANVNAAPVDYAGTLTTLNGYNSKVNLSCGVGATAPPPICSAFPTPLPPTTTGAPFTVAVASTQCSPPNTLPHTPYSFNIVAQGTDSSKTSHNVPVTFTVTSATKDDFSLEVTPSSQTQAVNTAAVFNGSLQGTTCYLYPVNLSCGSGAPRECKFSPATVVPNSTSSGAPFTLTAGSDVAATYNFEIAAVGTDPNATMHSYPVSLTTVGSGAPPRFSFTITPSSNIQSLPAGQPAIYGFDVTPSVGTFPNVVKLAYSGSCPPLSTCSLSTTQVGKGSGNTQVTFTITTTASVIAGVPSRGLRPAIYAFCLSLPALVLVFAERRGPLRKSRKRLVFFSLAFIVPLLWLEIACGGGLQGGATGNGQPGTPSGTYTMTVSGTMASLPPRTATVELTVN